MILIPIQCHGKSQSSIIHIHRAGNQLRSSRRYTHRGLPPHAAVRHAPLPPHPRTWARQPGLRVLSGPRGPGPLSLHRQPQPYSLNTLDSSELGAAALLCPQETRLVRIRETPYSGLSGWRSSDTVFLADSHQICRHCWSNSKWFEF